MSVFYNLDSQMPDIKGASLGLGFFDGVHLAHKKIIEKTVELANKNGAKSIIITFQTSPVEFFDNTDGKIKYLTSNSQKTALIKNLGVDYLYILDFASIKGLTGAQYIEEILYKNFKPKFITTGFNHSFGAARSGNPKLLSDLTSKFGYTYFEIPSQKIESTLISSSIIKEFIEQGDLACVKKFLGRNFEIEGIVEVGNRLGRTINFPTANLIWPEKIVKLPHGVYFGNTTVNSKTYPSLINWGARPTIDNKELLESHIIGFNDDIYGQTISVSFKNKLRDIVKFASLDELKAAIEKDCESIRKISTLKCNLPNN